MISENNPRPIFPLLKKLSLDVQRKFPLETGRKLKNVQGVFWMSYVRFFRVLWPGGTTIQKSVYFPYQDYWPENGDVKV